MPRKSDKRERLIAAGRDVIYQQGYSRTTLAKIAEAAQVPLGNVYYHFKTKELLARAVIDSRMDDLRARIADSESAPSPAERLVRFIMHGTEKSASVAAYGCAYGSLVQELDKDEADAPLRQAAAGLLQAQLDWMVEQFHEMGRGNEAEDLATQLLADIQGYCLIANTMADESLMKRGFERVAAWLRAQQPGPVN
ncbi:MAG: TetR/AcrR family transcriptional regulator [Myxococcota bacterium]